MSRSERYLSPLKADRAAALQAKREKALKLTREGELSRADIATRLGTTPRTVKVWCREAGVEAAKSDRGWSFR
jgi:DNA-binding CsgD family transcriptional regulator